MPDSLSAEYPISHLHSVKYSISNLLIQYSWIAFINNTISMHRSYNNISHYISNAQFTGNPSTWLKPHPRSADIEKCSGLHRLDINYEQRMICELIWITNRRFLSTEKLTQWQFMRETFTTHAIIAKSTAICADRQTTNIYGVGKSPPRPDLPIWKISIFSRFLRVAIKTQDFNSFGSSILIKVVSSSSSWKFWKVTSLSSSTYQYLPRFWKVSSSISKGC